MNGKGLLAGRHVAKAGSMCRIILYLALLTVTNNMIRGAFSDAGAELYSWGRRMTAGLGWRNSGAADDDGPSATSDNSLISWPSRTYRTLSVAYGPNISYLIFGGLLSVLFIFALIGAANETMVDFPPHEVVIDHGNLRGDVSEVETHSYVQSSNNTLVNGLRIYPTKSSSVHGTRSPSSSSQFWLSMVLSFLTWIIFIQVYRCLHRSAMVQSRSSGANVTTEAQRRESIRLISQLMQLGRGRAQGSFYANNLRLALLQRDFNGNDFEMLQSLDDDMPGGSHSQRGATQEQIDRLPLHEVSLAEATEHAAAAGGPPTCNICLGPYELHDSVRTVPCMHQFHQQCIDTWLREKAVCPICKSTITA
jgi:hypothetical protein